MENASKLLKNTLMLAASNIVLRLFALCFQTYLASAVGAGMMGLFGIISSVGVVFATVAISGVRFGVTRLAAEQCSKGNPYPKHLMHKAFVYGIFFGVLSSAVLFFASEFLSKYWVMNSSATVPLRIMALSMPLISLGAVAEGYFTAKQKIFRLVSTEILSQLTRVLFVWYFLSSQTKIFASPIYALAIGAFLGEAVLSIGMLVLYFFESKGKKDKGASQYRRIIKTSFPLAISAYMRTGLSSLGQIIIPRGLKKSGMNTESAFVAYGVITQMAFPVVMFPAALLGALGEILVPRLTGAQTMGRKTGISYIVNRALRIGIIFSFGIMGVMLFYSAELGESLCESEAAGRYIKIFALLVPIIYIDSVTDGCLKGLGQQLHSMVYNVLEGILNVTLLFFLLPKMAIEGYILVMYIKEIFNAVLSLRRLSRVSYIDKNLLVILSAVVAVILSYLFTGIVLPGGQVWISVLLYLSFYPTLLYILNAVTRDDIRWVVSLIRNEKNVKNPRIGVDKREAY